MEKAKTRSRAKAVQPSTAPNSEPAEPNPPPPPPQAIAETTAAAPKTPAKKVRKTKKKQKSSPSPQQHQPTPPPAPKIMTAPEVIPDTTTEKEPKGKKKAGTSKRMMKAEEIVAEIEQQEQPEEMSTMLDESTKLVTPAPVVKKTKAVKTKKPTGRKGRKKQTEEETVEEAQPEPVITKTPARPIPIIVEPPLEEELAATNKPTGKKRGRKPATKTATETKIQPEPEVVVEPAVVEVAIQPLVEKTIEETRPRTRTRTQPKAEDKPALNTTQDIIPASDNKPKQQQVEQPTTETEPKPPVEAPPSAKKPKIGGGARIVRPKETIVVVKTIVAPESAVEKVEVEKKVVEIVKREAGPRIVKPPEAILQEQQLAEKKRKLLAEQAENGSKMAKKLKEKTESAASVKKQQPAVVPAELAETAKKDTQPGNKPDFKSIHQKETSKMESILDFQKRLHQRHLTLNGGAATGGDTATINKLGATIRGGCGITSTASLLSAGLPTRTPSQPAPVSRMPKPIIQTAMATKETPRQRHLSVDPISKLKTKPNPAMQSTPKANNVLAAQSSNIPVFVNKQQPPKDVKLDAKTPKQHVSRPKTTTVDNIENIAKTPRSKTVMTQPTILAAAPKTPANQARNASNTTGDLLRSAQKNGQPGASCGGATTTTSGTTIPPQLATSSFIRRKSFDLNASLSRRLGYKPYIGKLKPIEVAAPKSAATAANILSTTKINLNCTKN